MEILVPSAAAAFLAVPTILALYFLKVRGPDTRVGSFVLWPEYLGDRQANAPWRRLRFSALLAVQLALAAVLAASLMRPGLVGAATVGRTTVVLIDGSPSMRATDVSPSRFDAAISQVRRMAGRLRAGDQLAVIVLGRHAQLLTAPTSDVVALREALDEARPASEAANLEEGFSLANAILAGRAGGSVLLLSDGHGRRPAVPAPLAAPLTYQSMGTSAENVAIETIGRTPAGDVFFRVTNHGSAPRDLKVEMWADDRLVDVVPVRVAEGSSAEPTWARLPTGTEVLEARLRPSDHLSLDNRAWLVTRPASRARVLVVTGAEGFLTRAVGLRDDLDVTVLSPTEYEPEPYDLYIFDGFVPPGPVPEPALVVAPPEGRGLVPVGPKIDPGTLLPGDPREPILQYVSLGDVHVQWAAAVRTPDGWRTVIDAANGPLLIISKGGPRLAQLNFDIHDSDLPLRPAFPFLMQNLVSYLLPARAENQVLPLGQPVGVGGPGIDRVEVRTPEGRRVELRPPFPATLQETHEPGIYVVNQRGASGTSTRHFVVGLQDPLQSRIAPGPQPQVRTLSRATGGSTPQTRELWPWLAGLALLALVVETTLFLRG